MHGEDEIFLGAGLFSTSTSLGGSEVERQPRKLLVAGSIPARGSTFLMFLATGHRF